MFKKLFFKFLIRTEFEADFRAALLRTGYTCEE